jgi:hypothetical protein
MLCLVLSSVVIPIGYFLKSTLAGPNDWEADQTGTISVSAGLLPPPTLYAPSNGATTGLQPTFSWSSVQGANYYWLTVATDPNKLPTDPYATNAPGCVIGSDGVGISATSLTPSQPLNPGTTYYWRVQAYYGSDAYHPIRQGQYSEIRSFKTISLPTIGSFSETIPQSGSKVVKISVSNPNDIPIKVTRFEITSVQSGFKGTMTIFGETKQITVGVYWNLNIDVSAGSSIQIEATIAVAADCSQGTYAIKYKLSGTP